MCEFIWLRIDSYACTSLHPTEIGWQCCVTTPDPGRRVREATSVFCTPSCLNFNSEYFMEATVTSLQYHAKLLFLYCNWTCLDGLLVIRIVDLTVLYIVGQMRYRASGLPLLFHRYIIQKRLRPTSQLCVWMRNTGELWPGGSLMFCEFNWGVTPLKSINSDIFPFYWKIKFNGWRSKFYIFLAFSYRIFYLCLHKSEVQKQTMQSPKCTCTCLPNSLSHLMSGFSV